MEAIAGNDVFDREDVQRRFVNDDHGHRAASFVVDNMKCAGCALNLERGVAKLLGVDQCNVNFSAQRADIAWDPQRIRLGAIIETAKNLGFGLAPFDPLRADLTAEAEFNAGLRRFGIAALCAMQVMMVAAAFYFDPDARNDPAYARLLAWMCLFFTLPVITYCAMPFTRGAWRALRTRTSNMDVPITLGLMLAFGGSVWALIAGRGEVYFDSIAMFVMLLLGSQCLQQYARLRTARYLNSLARIKPVVVQRINPDDLTHAETRVLAIDLKIGDRVRLLPAELIPVDGLIVSGESTVDEKVLTGESSPCHKRQGERVICGSINIESPLEVEVTALGEQTAMARIAKLAADAAMLAPRSVVVDKIAAYFTVGVLFAAALAVIIHGGFAGDDWLAPTIAVLVVSCPCALALAVPTAVNSALFGLFKRGVLVLQPSALSKLAQINIAVFDKTGTLTTGALALDKITPMRAAPALDPLAIAASLSLTSPHPISIALCAAYRSELPAVHNIHNQIGLGIEGTLQDGRTYFLGSARYIRAMDHDATVEPTHDEEPNKVCYLTDQDGIIARFTFTDALRPDAASIIDYLKAQGIRTAMLSGDQSTVVMHVANMIALDETHAECTPDEKLAIVESFIRRELGVLVVGDGVNDAPMLARAEVGVTLAAATDYAKLNSDIVLLQDNLSGLVTAHRIARRMVTISRQNQIWAVGYNVLSIPLALAGVITPLVASLLMAVSSLFVVGNALRVTKV